MMTDLKGDTPADTLLLLERLEKAGRCIPCVHPKSVVFVTKQDGLYAYYSPVSTQTLQKRAEDGILSDAVPTEFMERCEERHGEI